MTTSRDTYAAPFVSKHGGSYYVFDWQTGRQLAGPFAEYIEACAWVDSHRESPADIPSLSVPWSK